MDIYYKKLKTKEEVIRLFKALGKDIKHYSYLIDMVTEYPIYIYFESEYLDFYDQSYNLYNDYFEYDDYEEEEDEVDPSECVGTRHHYLEFPNDMLTLNKHLYKKILNLN